jgi:hypothetical protein
MVRQQFCRAVRADRNDREHRGDGTGERGELLELPPPGLTVGGP